MTIAHDPALDPTLPKVELKLGKQTYNLAFTFASLAIAEQQMRKLGQPINIFHALDFEALDASAMTALLYAALIPGHPEVTLADVPKLITVRAIPKIKQALFDAFVLSMVDPEDVADAPLEQA